MKRSVESFNYLAYLLLKHKMLISVNFVTLYLAITFTNISSSLKTHKNETRMECAHVNRTLLYPDE